MSDKPKILSGEDVRAICENCSQKSYDLTGRCGDQPLCRHLAEAQADMSEERGRELQFVEDVEWLARNNMIPRLIYRKAHNVYEWTPLKIQVKQLNKSMELIGLALAVKAKLEVK